MAKDQRPDEQTYVAVQATRIHFSIQRDLRRDRGILGLWTSGCRIKTQCQKCLVAGYGHRA